MPQIIRNERMFALNKTEIYFRDSYRIRMDLPFAINKGGPFPVTTSTMLYVQLFSQSAKRLQIINVVPPMSRLIRIAGERMFGCFAYQIARIGEPVWLRVEWMTLVKWQTMPNR